MVAKLARGQWARDYNHCQECGTTEKPHHARGMCKGCWQNWYMKCILQEDSERGEHYREIRRRAARAYQQREREKAQAMGVKKGTGKARRKK